MREVHKEHLTLTAHRRLNTTHLEILMQKINLFPISAETRERTMHIEKAISSSSNLAVISGASFKCVVPFQNH
jgi:hypothetical protein